jgi:Ca2+-binding RTX toxin-like protein
MSMPTIDQIVSRYLFNSDTPPTNLVDENLIRPAGTLGDSVHVDAVEFMATGGGRFADIARFNVVLNFLSEDDYGGQLPPGYYTAQQLYDMYSKFPGAAGKFQIKDGIVVPPQLGIEQYYNDIYSSDYSERSYVFGSSSFQINDDAMFYVGEDGTRRIDNICVVPVNDNFDYKSDNWLAKTTNALTQSQIDPSGIGRTVPIVFDNTDLIPSQTLTQADLPALEARNDAAQAAEDANIALMASAIVPGTPMNIYFSALAAGVLTRLVVNDIITYQTRDGKFVIYDGADPNNNGVIDASYIGYRNITEIIPYKGTVVVGGSGNDQITGTEWNDTLYGNAGDDTLVGGAGSDTLVGGAGDDTYDLSGNAAGDVDTIIDSDGQGTIKIGDQVISGAFSPQNTNLVTGQGVGSYYSADKQYQLQNLLNGNWVLSVNNGSGVYSQVALLQGWTDTSKPFLGLSLNGAPNNSYVNAPLLDLRNSSAYLNMDASTYTNPAGTGGVVMLGNNGKSGSFTGSGYDDFIMTGDGGSSTKYVMAYGGNDIIYGGSGRDLIRAGANSGTNDDDIVYGGEDSDIIYGGNGRDYIRAGANSGTNDDDVVYGGEDNDIIYGGAGDVSVMRANNGVHYRQCAQDWC